MKRNNRVKLDWSKLLGFDQVPVHTRGTGTALLGSKVGSKPCTITSGQRAAALDAKIGIEALTPAPRR